MEATEMKKLLKWLGLRKPTREELESKYDASITLWGDSEEEIMSKPIRKINVVAENLEHASEMCRCDYDPVPDCCLSMPEGEVYLTPDGKRHVNSTCVIDS